MHLFSLTPLFHKSFAAKFINRCLDLSRFNLCLIFCGSISSGVAARPGKVVGSVMRYNNCGVAVTADVEQRRMVRNPNVSAQYAASSYPRRSNPSCKNERAEDDGIEGSNGLQPKPQYMARKVAAAQGGPGGQWY